MHTIRPPLRAIGDTCMQINGTTGYAAKRFVDSYEAESWRLLDACPRNNIEWWKHVHITRFKEMEGQTPAKPNEEAKNASEYRSTVPFPSRCRKRATAAERIKTWTEQVFFIIIASIPSPNSTWLSLLSVAPCKHNKHNAFFFRDPSNFRWCVWWRWRPK